jgi:hypothetical protein
MKQRLQLVRIEPSASHGLEYRPCSVTLADGTVLDRVYVVTAKEYYRVWGVWPEDDEGKQAVDIGEVAEIAESPERLPFRLANEVYEAKESGMGYHVFTVEWRDEFKQPYITGSAVDFLPVPEGRSLRDAMIVLPHEGRHDPATLKGLDYHWCLYGE